MEKARSEAVKLLKEAGLDACLADVRLSDKADLEYSQIFGMAKKAGRNPIEFAQEVAAKFKPGKYVIGAEAVKGYINLTVDFEQITRDLLGELEECGADYGRGEKKEEKIVLEHTSVNPSGPVHVGRLRNSIIGDSLRRILSFNGFEVETLYWVNDIGKQIAIISQGFAEGVPDDKDAVEYYRKYADKDDFKVFFKYVSSNRRFEEDEGFRDKVQAVIRSAEAGDRQAMQGVTSVARRCLDGQKETFSRLGFIFDEYDFESDMLASGKVEKVLATVKKSRLASENENGTGADLSEYGIEKRGGLSVLARTDGTSVYLARDIAYHLQKMEKGGRMINILGEDHKLEFMELKTILENIFGNKKQLDVVHFSFVSFEGAKLSTRSGRIASVDELLDEAEEKAVKEIMARGIADPSIAPAIGVGAVKYHIVKTTPNKQITFRWSDALSFEGDAAPYIQYAHARCSRILEKAGKPGRIGLEGIGVDLAGEEKELVRELSLFTSIVDDAASQLRPDLVASYLYRLATAFSRFYKECQVIQAPGKMRERRLLLVDAVRQVTATGLELLGIKAPRKM